MVKQKKSQGKEQGIHYGQKKITTAIAKRYGECSEVLVFLGKRGRKTVRIVKNHGGRKILRLQVRYDFYSRRVIWVELSPKTPQSQRIILAFSYTFAKCKSQVLLPKSQKDPQMLSGVAPANQTKKRPKTKSS